MSKAQDRQEVVRKLHDAAEQYRYHLVGKKFLYVFDGRYIEVIFKSDNFRHLTGVATSLSAKSFYAKAAQRKLAANQIFFTSVHPYALCIKKLQHICQIASMASSESFMLEEIATHTQTYKFGTTDLNFSLCLNKELDDSGHEKGDCYVVQSLRDEDCFSKSRKAYEVTHIFSKANDVKEYETLLYQSNATPSLPSEVYNLICSDLKHQFTNNYGNN